MPRPFRGFTLIELVTIMIVLGIMSVFAVGRLDFTSVFEQRGVQDKAKAALQFARRAALAERRYVCVAIAGGRIALTLDSQTPESGSGFCDGTHSVDLNLPARDGECGGAANAVCSSANATIASGTAAFAFDPQGRSTAAANVTVTVTGQSGVTVEGTTGYVH